MRQVQNGIMNKIHARKKAIIDLWGRDPETLDELAHCVIAVIESRFSKEYNKAPPYKVLGFAWELRHSNEVSNTHECPLDGVTNWGRRDPTAPSYYPGWVGRVWIRYDGVMAGSAPFVRTLTHPGTGGYGGYNGPWEKLQLARHYHMQQKNQKNLEPPPYPELMIFSWDYKFFDSDWPCLGKDRLFDILKETDQKLHRFLWEDPITKSSDEWFLAKCDPLLDSLARLA